MYRLTLSIAVALVAFSSMAAARPAALPPDSIAHARSRIWHRFISSGGAESTLPVPSPLDAPDSLLWHIPDSLEPHADLNFHLGVKGRADRYPLFIYLHGSGPRDHEWRAGLSLARIFDDAPALYFIPQIPNEGEYYRWYQRSKQWVVERLLRAALASDIVDPQRIYLLGISEGGYGSQRLASFYADYLAAAGPMAGGEPLFNAPPENLRNTPFSLLTGADDRTFCRHILTARAGSALDSLRQAAADSSEYVHNVRLIPGCGHAIDYRPTTPWLSRFRRNASPRRITWENFPMDGRYRTGFGNIQVIERSNSDESARTRYDLSIGGSDNVVELNVSLVTYTVSESDPHFGIPLSYVKSSVPASNGRVRIFLDENLIDFSRPVTLIVNGRRLHCGYLTPNEEDLRLSCEEFADPLRLYPASLTVDLSSGQVD